MRRHREAYEFAKSTKLEAKRRAEYKCRRCGRHEKEVGKLEAHHLLPIAVAIKYYPHILPELIKSIYNCEMLCSDCHKLEDQDSFQNHRTIAIALQYMQELDQQWMAHSLQMTAQV